MPLVLRALNFPPAVTPMEVLRAQNGQVGEPSGTSESWATILPNGAAGRGRSKSDQHRDKRAAGEVDGHEPTRLEVSPSSQPTRPNALATPEVVHGGIVRRHRAGHII